MLGAAVKCTVTPATSTVPLVWRMRFRYRKPPLIWAAEGVYEEEGLTGPVVIRPSGPCPPLEWSPAAASERGVVGWE